MVGRKEGVGKEGGAWRTAEIMREGNLGAVWAPEIRVGPSTSGKAVHVAIPARRERAFASSIKIAAYVGPRYGSS